MKLFRFFLVLGICVCIAGCGSKSKTASPVAATSSYLAAAVRDVMGGNFDVMLLSSPGQCPGHFDMTPGQLRELRSARLILRFDFQSQLDAKLSQPGETATVAGIKPGGGLSEISTYYGAVKQTADALVKAGMITQELAKQRLAEISQRLDAMKANTQKTLKACKLDGQPVISSQHQKKFCESLGLKVVACFTSRDNPTEMAKVVESAKKHDVKLVVGNVPEGPAAAEKLADHLSVAMVMLNNFPTADGKNAFDKMYTDNVNRIISAEKQ